MATLVKILFLTHRRETPSTRYRVTQLLPYLRASGIAVESREIPSGVVGRIGLPRSLGRFDVVVIQKKLISRLFLRAIRKSARRLVYDFDDAVMMESETRRSRFDAMLRAADLAIAGNEYLRQQARGRAEVLPTGIESAGYRVHSPAGGAILGWIGTGGNLEYLEEILPALEKTGTVLRVVCDRFPRSARIPIERRVWSERTEAEDLSGIDIGLAPLPDDPWTRGKCGLKILQYMACGVPVIASPVGVQPALVEGAGILAATGRDWIRAIGELSGDPEKRRRLGAVGRARAEKEYAASRIAEKLVAILRSL